MAVPKANMRAVSKYIKNNYDEVKIRVYKGQRDILQQAAVHSDTSVNAYVSRAVRSQIIADGGDVTAWDALTPRADEPEREA